MNDDEPNQTHQDAPRRVPTRRRGPTVPLLPSFIAAAAMLGAAMPPRREPKDRVLTSGVNLPPTLPTVSDCAISREKRRVEAMANAVGGFTGTLDLLAPRGFPPGPCEICGKPNVRAGREAGVYRCGQHMEA